jgi:hypothetical protein
MTDRTSQVERFSIFVFIFNHNSEWGKKHDTILHNKHVPLDTQKMANLHSKCMHHLCGCYSQSILTFWTCLVRVNTYT